MVERLNGIEEVRGSNPLGSTFEKSGAGTIKSRELIIGCTSEGAYSPRLHGFVYYINSLSNRASCDDLRTAVQHFIGSLGVAPNELGFGSAGDESLADDLADLEYDRVSNHVVDVGSLSAASDHPRSCKQG